MLSDNKSRNQMPFSIRYHIFHIKFAIFSKDKTSCNLILFFSKFLISIDFYEEEKFCVVRIGLLNFILHAVTPNSHEKSAAVFLSLF